MKLEISASQLSFGMHGDDVVRVQRAIEALGRSVPASDVANRTLGAGTAAVLKALQAELGLPATGVVDAATVRAINARLSQSATAPRVVRGSVRDADGKPLASGFVQIYHQGRGGEQVLGKSPLDAADGSYTISYQPPPDANGLVDLRIAVLDGTGPLETTPSGASILTNAGPLEVVDFVLSGAANPPRSEFERVLADLAPLLGTRDLASLTEEAGRHEVSLLATQSGYTPEQVAALVLAHRLEEGTRTPAAVFYGLIRQGLPSDALALHTAHPERRMKALQAAVGQGAVPGEISGKKIEDYLPDLAPAAPARPLQGLLGLVLDARELERFVGQYLQDSQDPDAFWGRLAADPAWASRTADLKLVVQLGALTNNHAPVVAALRARPDVKQASDLVRLTEDDWKSLIQARGVGVPADTPGADADEKTANFARQIVARVEAAFPTQFLAERLGTSPVAAFLKAHPSYDLKTTYPALFFKRNPAAAEALGPQQRQQLQALQRVQRLTGNAQEAIALSARGIRSAQQISLMARDVFADEHKDVLPTERANEVYDRALRTSAMALTLFGEHAAGLNRTGLQALPKLDVEKQARLAADNPVPDWQTLFGAFDLCACQDCASVHGAAAYFVDALHFLDERGALPSLFARRPDLGEIELSCENTNTPLPLVDLVNEILEDAVAPPASFAPFSLAPALEADLGQTVATAALTVAFDPPLQPGARVETIESGKRWRVWDEPFTYSVVKDGGALNVAARSRQTTGSAAERRATPQYRNRAAYQELARAVYPWTLPFDLPGEEAKVLLAHLGVSRGDLIRALRPAPEPYDPNAPVVVHVAAERLGLTDTERRIIVGEPLTPARPPEDFWGSAPVTLLATVQELLDRSGLGYAELEALAATWFVDPAGVVAISARPDAPIDTCDTTKLRIDGLTADVLDRMHRFVRLWRRLGWTIPEVDRAIHALTPDPDTPALTNELLVRLEHLRTLCSELRLSVAQTLALWGSIDTAEPGSLYRSLFDNPAVLKPQDEAFRLRPDGQELLRTDELLVDHGPAVQAACRLSPADLSSLLAKTDGGLNLANLSLVYRHAIFARQLRLTIPDLLTAIELTGIDPFRSDRFQDTLRFVDAVKAIRASGFGFGQLDYLLRRRPSAASPFAPVESSLARTLAEVRSGLAEVDAPSDAETQQLHRSAVIDRVSAALDLPGDVTAGLLARTSHEGETTLQRLVDLLAIDAEILARENAGAQFETLEHLLRIATIVRALGLPGSRLDWLFRENPWLAAASGPVADAVPFASWFSLVQLRNLRRDLALEDAALEAMLAATSAVAAAEDPAGQRAARKAFVDSLSTWLGWPVVDLEALVGKPEDLGDLGLLNARLPDDYRVDLVARLHRAMSLVKRLGTTAGQADQWCDATVSDADAKAIRGAVKARYDDEAWEKLAPPLQDSLRDKQREALAGYLVARPAMWTSLDKADVNDLYAHFLIDVEMTSCQLTSRMKQAIGSVQLFAQRGLMGLEPGVQTADSKWQQWTSWMKSFRVWEANRKVWLYPENWIEPELRDDKSPFFKELEGELLQSDLDDAAAEQAFRRYLEKLDQVAQLEVVGVYEDDEDKALHVFGRTFHAPHIYYYRRRDGATRAWRPWEKVDVDIEGDHLIPVVWNRKLMLIWPIFTDKAKDKQVVMPEPGNKLDSADHYWDIQLAWSEYQNGRWTGKSLSEAVKLTAYQGEDDILFGEPVVAPGNTMFLAPRDDNGSFPDPLGGGGGDPDDDPGGNPPPGARAPRRLVSKELIAFKALVSADTLAVRGFLRRDYRRAPDAVDSQIAYPFGEFRFSGCRKLVTAAHNSLIPRRNFALAPTGTKFDRMWFTQSTSGLVLFDGTFPAFPPFIHPGVLTDVNEPSIAGGDPTPTLVNRLDIPVLGRTPWPFRLLAPHQDLQFVCDRPFFFMDTRRAFMVTSTGSSGKKPDLGSWVNADLATAWRADYFPAPAPAAPGGEGISTEAFGELHPLTVLAPGPRGRRVARAIVPVNLAPAFSPRTLLPTFWTSRQYSFTNFHHPYLCEFVKTLDRRGIRALLSLDTQRAVDDQSFDAYQPEARVLQAHPVDEVEFRSGGAYELYNWELFFHIPLLIADRLSKNQRFEDAQRWFHYIFDPTGASGGEVPQRYWRTRPFHDRLSGEYEAESVKTLEELAAHGPSEALTVAVDVWRSNPFNPHAVARLRTTAYQKTVVMKYIDNLIAWGDQLFRRETLESINEATHLYVLAAEILGRRPTVIERNVKPPVQTFNGLAQVGLLGNALEQIELLISDSGSPGGGGTTDPPSAPVLYFCVPENDKLLGYWTTVADRLFKIRHCMNIEGQVRQLPLFEPPIDPALLVRAQAAGLSLADVLNDISVSRPNYRFAVMLQKANEVVAEVRNLGAGLLSTLEKRDAETLSTLRSGQELRLLQALRDVRVHQIDEATASIAALEKSHEMARARRDYYESREKLDAFETTSLLLLGASAAPIEISAHLRVLAGLVQKFGSTKIGSPTTAGVEVGGYYVGVSIEEAAIALDAAASILNIASQVTGRMAEYGRRQDEWDHQANLAAIEVKQIEQQLAAARIRLAVAQQELRAHDQQVENARDVDRFLRDKFTNQDLYQWMIGQVSGLYFQSYQLAYDLAKRAERCMQHELGLAYGETAFIRFGYWDSLRKGLLAGDHLAHDLKRLEIAYLDRNVREYELTKHVSLVSLAPEQFLALKETGACEFEIPEWLFDLDTPGHYRRRLKMVSLTIPCVTGPYASIHCKLQLLKSSYRRSADIDPVSGYDRRPADDTTGPDERFIDDRSVLEAIVTSTAQNDAGLFEPTMRDERYLPFEGAGAISTWRLELPTAFRTFDYGTISDVILHLRYTAQDAGDEPRAAATASVTNLLGAATARPLFRLFSLRHEFPSEWHRFVSAPPSAVNTMTADLAATRFPYFVQSRHVTVKLAQVIARTRSTLPSRVALAPGQAAPDLTHSTWTGHAEPGPWTFGTDSDPKALEDVFVILAYSVG